MIVKIERYIDKAENDPRNWWMEDNIRKIHKIEFELPFGQEMPDDDAIIFDYEHYLNKLGAGQDRRRAIRLICRIGDGSERSIVFDTVAYILNDDGKTIEKLVANHR